MGDEAKPKASVSMDFSNGKGEILSKLTEKRRAPNVKRDSKLRKLVEVRRIRRKKINRDYESMLGHHLTMKAFLRIKLLGSEQEIIDKETVQGLEKVEALKADIESKLERRAKGLLSGLIDPEEPTGKENERKARVWLEMVPALFKRYEDNKKKDVEAELDLKKLTTVLNYIDEGNNQGAADAVSITVDEGDDSSSNDEDNDSEMSSDEAMSDSDSDRNDSSSDSDTGDSLNSDTEDE